MAQHAAPHGPADEKGYRVPLHPQVKLLLDGLAQLEGKPIDELTPTEARALFRTLAQLEQGEEVARVDDRHVPLPEGDDIPVRVYTPAAGIGVDTGVLVWFHGGGWVIGDLDTADSTCRALANRSGAVVVSVDYRLAPEHPAPAALDDCLEALMWTVENGELLGIDVTKLAVGGDSAGGNLAALVCQRVRDDFGPAIEFQLLVYPVTDLTLSHPSIDENAEGYFLTRDSLVWFCNHYLGNSDPKSASVSPLHAESLAGLPPALIITAEFDPLRDEGEAYGAALREAGVSAEVVRYDGQIHGFFGMATTLDDGKDALDRAGAALRSALA
jgi:acetyl esterase